MSTHPNVILLLVLRPDGLTRKTFRDIVAENYGESGRIEPDDDLINIGSDSSYFIKIMEDSYHSDYQISAKEDDIVVFDHVTYGYGKVIRWDVLEDKKNELEQWAIGVCKRHNCSYQIFITANYW